MCVLARVLTTSELLGAGISFFRQWVVCGRKVSLLFCSVCCRDVLLCGLLLFYQSMGVVGPMGRGLHASSLALYVLAFNGGSYYLV